jgi:putative NADPH-quinone reductase
MRGKKFMISATWNAPREAFDNLNGVLYGGKGPADLFLHITSNYKVCVMARPAWFNQTRAFRAWEVGAFCQFIGAPC